MDMMLGEVSRPFRATEDVPLTGGVEVWRIPQGRYVDAVRWMPPARAWDQSVATALWDPDVGTFMLELASLSVDEGHNMHTQASWQLPARASALKTSPLSSQHALVAAATYGGALCFVVTSLFGPSGASHTLVTSSPIHDGAISGMDLQLDTHDCISVGEDGKINLTKLAESHLKHTCLIDNHGLTSFMAAHWASPAEFVTAGLGFSLQWWDHRRSGGPVQMSSKWTPGRGGVGSIHSVDVHPSRKHVCAVGGSNGTVLAWDLRWQKEPIQLCGISDLRGQPVGESMAESDVWEVKFDPFSLSGSTLSSKIPPIMMCTEDGIVGVLEAGEAPWEILAEPCAINTVDINAENPTDIVCGLEFESLLYLRRSS